MSHKVELEQAIALRDCGFSGDAIAAFQTIIDCYPDSDSAELARAHIFQIQNPEPTTTPEGASTSAAEALDTAAARIIVSTAPFVAGHDVAETLDVVTSECAFGMNIFHDIFSSFRDVFGGRSASVQEFLRKARVTCLNELRKEAVLVGADAVISVSLSYSEISGGNKSMLFLVASGTAVKLTPHERKTA